MNLNSFSSDDVRARLTVYERPNFKDRVSITPLNFIKNTNGKFKQLPSGYGFSYELGVSLTADFISCPVNDYDIVKVGKSQQRGPLPRCNDYLRAIGSNRRNDICNLIAGIGELMVEHPDKKLHLFFRCVAVAPIQYLDELEQLRKAELKQQGIKTVCSLRES